MKKECKHESCRVYGQNQRNQATCRDCGELVFLPDVLNNYFERVESLEWLVVNALKKDDE